MGRRWAALWSALAVVLAAVLAVVSGLAVGAVPASWTLAHNGGVLWGITGGVVVASVVIGVLQARASGNSWERAARLRRRARLRA